MAKTLVRVDIREGMFSLGLLLLRYNARWGGGEELLYENKRYLVFEGCKESLLALKKVQRLCNSVLTRAKRERKN